MSDKRGYWILTIQRLGRSSFKTVWHEGSINDFLLFERELGKETNVLFSAEISEDEYNKAMNVIKHGYLLVK